MLNAVLTPFPTGRSAVDLVAQMNHLMEALDPASRVAHATATRAGRLTDAGDHYLLQLDAPGVREQDIDLTVEGQRLSVALRRELAAPEGARPLRRERQAWRFEQAFELPEPIEVDAVSAELRHGRLDVRVPKAQVAGPRRIAINTTQPALDVQS